MSAPTKNVVALDTATTVELTDKVLLVDVSDTTEGPLGTVKVAETQTVGTVFGPYISQAENAADQAAASASAAAQIVNISQVQTFTNPLSRAVRIAMTAAASGSNGIQVLDNVQSDFGTGNYTLVRRIFVASTRPSANQILSQKHDGTNGRIVTLLTTGVIRHTINGTPCDSTVALDSASNVFLDLAIVVTRETASAAGSVVFYNNGLQIGASVTIPVHGSTANFAVNGTFDADTNWTKGAGWTIGSGVATKTAGSSSALQQSATLTAGAVYEITVTVTRSAGSLVPRLYGGTDQSGTAITSSGTFTRRITAVSGNNAFGFSADSTFAGTVDDVQISLVVSIDNAVSGYILGTSTTRVAGEVYNWLNYNRALSAAEVLSLSVIGPALADLGASQTPQTSGSLVIGRRYRIDTFVAGDSFTNVGAASNASGVEFVATGTTPTTWTNSSSLRRIGITAQYNAQDAQSDTGQIFDSSGNKNHALLPASGATVIGRPQSDPRRVEWPNTWAATNELQYIGGANQPILETRTGWIVMDIFNTGASVTVDVGDGVDQDRFVAAAVLATGPNRVTFASPFTDGTNRKLTIKPSASFTGTLITSATYQLVRAS